MKGIAIALLAAALAGPALAQAPAAGDHAAHHAAAALAEGEVRKVDKDAHKITIRHGPIPSLDMPPMTMVFRLKDPAMLGQLKAGDKMRFAAERIGGQYTVTHIEAVR